MMNPSRIVACLALALVPALAGTAAADDDRDEVLLTSGETLHGRVTLELDQRICLQVGHRERWLERTEVKGLRTVSGSLRELWSSFHPENASSVVELARHADFCREQGLVHEERLFLWKLLRAEPDHAEAHHRLGHRLNGQTWFVQVGTRWVDLASAEEMRSSWCRAWEMRTEHFALKCDAGLDNALRALFLLELLYQRFIALYQRELELRELLEPIQVELFQDPNRVPVERSAEGSMFSTRDGILYSCTAGQELRPEPLLREGLQALIHGLAGRTRSAFPTWLFEAWPLYLETRFEIGKTCEFSLKAEAPLDEGYRNILVRERRVIPLTRILAFDEGDYRPGNEQSLHLAQSYLLFHFLEHGEEGKYRDPLREYMREAFAGKGRPAAFRKAFSTSLRTLDRSLRRYVLGS